MPETTDADRARCEAAGWTWHDMGDAAAGLCGINGPPANGHRITERGAWVEHAVPIKVMRQSCTECLLAHLDGQQAAPTRCTACGQEFGHVLKSSVSRQRTNDGPWRITAALCMDCDSPIEAGAEDEHEHEPPTRHPSRGRGWNERFGWPGLA